MSKILRELNYLRYRAKDSLLRKIAWRLPARLVMWCFYRVLAHATIDKYGKTIVPEITAMDAIDRFAKDKQL